MFELKKAFTLMGLTISTEDTKKLFSEFDKNSNG